MRREDIKVLMMRAPGTNCDLETVRSFQDLGITVDLTHTQQVFKQKNLLDYNILVFPGGFSYGDYVRSGAIWAKECEYRIGHELEMFVDQGRPVLGVCNGFQQLVELGFLPGFEGKSIYPQAALANSSHGYQNRWIRMKYIGHGNCGMMSELKEGQVISCPVAHGEGRFVFPTEKQEEWLKKLYDFDMLVWRYVDVNGDFANGKWPENPNGAYHDIAGICNPEGTVLGLMPHPERAYHGWLMPEWTKGSVQRYGDGFLFYESIVRYTEKHF